MKRIGIMAVLISALMLGSCDLLKTKENMKPESRELSNNPEEKDPGKD